MWFTVPRSSPACRSPWPTAPPRQPPPAAAPAWGRGPEGRYRRLRRVQLLPQHVERRVDTVILHLVRPRRD
eukprot:3129259-Prymnesium_polylepis.1